MLIKIKNKKDFERATQLLQLGGVEIEQNPDLLKEFCEEEASDRVSTYEKRTLPEWMCPEVKTKLMNRYLESEILDNEYMQTLLNETVLETFKENGFSETDLIRWEAAHALVKGMSFKRDITTEFLIPDSKEFVTIQFYEDIQKDRQRSLWFDCAEDAFTVKYRGHRLDCVVLGYEEATLYEDTDWTKRVCDFDATDHQSLTHLPNDASIETAIKNGLLDLDYGTRFELHTDASDEFIELGSVNVSGAIVEILMNIERYFRDLELTVLVEAV